MFENLGFLKSKFSIFTIREYRKHGFIKVGEKNPWYPRYPRNPRFRPGPLWIPVVNYILSILSNCLALSFLPKVNYLSSAGMYLIQVQRQKHQQILTLLENVKTSELKSVPNLVVTAKTWDFRGLAWCIHSAHNSHSDIALRFRKVPSIQFGNPMVQNEENWWYEMIMTLLQNSVGEFRLPRNQSHYKSFQISWPKLSKI